MPQVKTTYDATIAEAVAKGLARPEKRLPSWLFYDEEGDRLFQQIMRMPEYYPTRCEYDLLQHHKEELLSLFSGDQKPFRLIELGAGDGLKTEILLEYFLSQKEDFTYSPVDISLHVLGTLQRRLTVDLPGLRIDPQHKTYDEALATLHDPEEKKVILFMGANIGNFTVPEAVQFLKRLATSVHEQDQLLIGFDLKKDPRVIMSAYDDPRGITAEFNINILRRLNRELGADFNLNHFTHYPYYDPETGTTKSSLISTVDQTVYIEALQRSFHFRGWESVQTEVSQKYDRQMIESLLALTGFRIEAIFTDARKYFCDVLVRTAQ